MKKLTVLTLLLALAVSAPVLAQRGGFGDCPQDGPKFDGHGRDGGGRGFDGPCGMRKGNRGPNGIQMILAHGDDISLTDQQRTKLENMVVEFQTSRVDKRAELEKAQISLRALMRDDNASEITVTAAMDKVTALKGEMKKMQYRHRKSVEGVLTAEQLDKLKEMRKEFRQDGQGPRQGGQGRQRG